MNNPTISTKIEAVIKNLPQNKSPRSDDFIGEFYQTFTEELRPILLELFQKTAEEGILPNSFYKATINLIPIPDKDNTKKENHRPISITGENRCKNPQKNFSKRNSATHHKDKLVTSLVKLGLFQECKDSSIYTNQSM